MMRKLALLSALGLAACAPQPIPIVQGDPVAVNALFALPDLQYLAQLSLARRVADACPNYGYNAPFAQGLTAQRAVTTANQRAVDIELDVATRSLQARYDLDFVQNNLCAVGDGEVARQAPLSAVLIAI